MYDWLLSSFYLGPYQLFHQCLIWGSGLSHQLPPRVSSDESSPDAVKDDPKKKKPAVDKKKKNKDKTDKKGKKRKDDEDDDDQPDEDHVALPAGSDDDDDEDFGLEGLDELLDVDGKRGGGSGKASKKPATKGGAKKRPSTKKRDEAPIIVAWNEVLITNPWFFPW